MATPWRSPPDSSPTIESGEKTFDVKPISRIKRSASAFCLRTPMKPQWAGDLAPHEDVARDGLLYGQRPVLVDGLDAGSRGPGRPSSARPACRARGSRRSRRIHARQDLDQRRFAGAVVADQPDHLGVVDDHAHIAQGADVAVGLGHFSQFDQMFCHVHLRWDLVAPPGESAGGGLPPAHDSEARLPVSDIV